MRGTKYMMASVAAAALAGSALALPPGFKAKADALLAASIPADGPGAAVVVSEGGRIVYQGGRGLADVEAKRPITPQTVFRIGSITKQFSAAVVLQLAAEGKLKLTDPISKYLPDYPQPGGSATVAQLLNHTVGIQSYTSIPGWMVEANTNRAYTTAQLMAVFKDLPAPTKPGEKWDYNNSGYILVGALIEAVTGKPWSVAVDERIAKPLGLSTLRHGTDEHAIPAMAKGYTEGEKGPEAAAKIHMSVPGAAGALVGTVGDLATWGHALHHGKVMPATYYAQMIAPTALPDGKTEAYGFGIGTSKVRGAETIGHSGGIFGFSSDSVYLPSADLFVAVLANSDRPAVGPSMLTRKLSALAIGKPFEEFETVALDRAAAAPLLGVYKFKDMERIVRLDGDKLVYHRSDGSSSELFPAGGGKFHFGPRTLTWLEFGRDAAGKPTMTVYPNGENEVDLGRWSGPAPALVTVAVPRATLDSYAGTYTSPMGKVTIAVGEGERLTVQLAGQPALPLRATADNAFVADQVGATIGFTTAAGKVSGLEIDQGGRKLPATRD